MARTDLLRGVGVFVLVVAVVLAGTAVTGALVSDSPDTATDVNATAYESDSLVATSVGDDGTVATPDADERKTVVIDKSHGNAVSKDDIQPLVDALVRDGHDVRFYTGGGTQSFGSTGGSDLNATLRTADAFVVVNPASTYTDGEINGVESFADAGGRVLMLADPVDPAQSQSVSVPIPIGTGSGSSVTPGQPTNLAARFGITFGSGYLYDMTTNANNFQSIYARPSGNSSLTAGVEDVVVRDATSLTLTEDANATLETAEARSSATRRSGQYPVVAQVGNVTTVGDTDFLAPASATVADNEQFVGNLASFLVSGVKQGTAPESESSLPGSGSFTPPSQPANGTTEAT